jgi:hypothetical protein
MEDEVRACTGNSALHGRQIPHIADLMVRDPASQRKLLKKRGIGGRGKCEPVDLRPEGKKPFAEPTSLKPGVSGDKNTPVLEGF